MTAKEFRRACADLNLNLSGMARNLGVSRSTTSHWARGHWPVPRMAQLAIKSMLDELDAAERGAEDAEIVERVTE